MPFETESQTPDRDSNTPKAPKDKKCPYCGQAFTSSSLGRHLDLYIKERNPKPPDGVHDVDAIRKLRGNITRRQPRGSLAGRDTSTPAGTPTAASRKSPASDDAALRSPAAHRDNPHSADPIGRHYPFNTPWEATGVINDLSTRAAETSRLADGGEAARPAAPSQRAASRQIMKAQFDMKSKVQDAMDTAKAAELALREMLSSWRAAKLNIDMSSTPFDFEPLALDFPALCLQCLEPPPTLFSSTQHPTATSWSILPPEQKQLEALQSYFADEFKRWRITCAGATTAFNEDLTYPPSAVTFQNDSREAVRRAEKIAESLEKQVAEHVQSMFAVWQALSQQQRQEFWILELARSVGRKQKELDGLERTQHSLKQENANLKSQIEHLNRLQQPREFKIMSPATLPFDRKMVAWFQEQSIVHGRSGVGMNINDRHSDLNTLVATAIDRWKTVIVSARSAGGMNAQRPLNAADVSDQATGSAGSMDQTGADPNGMAETLRVQQQQSVPTLQTPQPHRSSTSVSNGVLYATSAAAATSATSPAKADTPGTENRQPSTAPTTASTSLAASVSAAGDEDDDMSDQDADAEMDDDDGFVAMNTPTVATPVKLETQQQQPVANLPSQQTPQLGVPRTRRAAQQRLTNGVARSVTLGSPAHQGAVNTGRSIAMQPGHANVRGMGGRNQGSKAPQAEMGMMQGVGGDPMYMD